MSNPRQDPRPQVGGRASRPRPRRASDGHELDLVEHGAARRRTRPGAPRTRRVPPATARRRDTPTAVQSSACSRGPLFVPSRCVAQRHPRAMQLRLRRPDRDAQQRPDLLVPIALDVVRARTRRVRPAATASSQCRCPSARRSAGRGAVPGHPVEHRLAVGQEPVARRASVRNRSMITLTASRCSQVPNDDSPRNVPSFCQTRTNTSCVSSSAESGPAIRRARLCTRPRWAW